MISKCEAFRPKGLCAGMTKAFLKHSALFCGFPEPSRAFYVSNLRPVFHFFRGEIWDVIAKWELCESVRSRDVDSSLHIDRKD